MGAVFLSTTLAIFVGVLMSVSVSILVRMILSPSFGGEITAMTRGGRRMVFTVKSTCLRTGTPTFVRVGLDPNGEDAIVGEDDWFRPSVMEREWA